MKPIILRIAGWLAVAGLASCVGGFAQGGKPVAVQLGWQDGQLQTNYTEITPENYRPQRPAPTETPVAVDVPVGGGTAPESTPAPAPAESTPAPVESTPTPAESVPAPAESPPSPAGNTPPAAPQTGAITPAHTPRGLQIEVLGGKVVVSPGENWGLTVENTDAYTVRMDEGVWEIESVGRTPDEDAVFTVTVPYDTALDELELSMGAGTLFAAGLTSRSADFSVGAGEMVMTDITVELECDIEVGMGSLSLTGDLRRGADIECGMGKLECTLLRPADYGCEIECAMGSVELDGKSYAGLATEAVLNPRAAVKYDIECGVGSVKLVLTDAP